MKSLIELKRKANPNKTNFYVKLIIKPLKKIYQELKDFNKI